MKLNTMLTSKTIVPSASDLLMALVVDCRERAAILPKNSRERNAVLYRMYRFKELRDRTKINEGRIRGLKLSKSETAQTWVKDMKEQKEEEIFYV